MSTVPGEWYDDCSVPCPYGEGPRGFGPRKAVRVEHLGLGGSKNHNDLNCGFFLI